MSSQYIFTMHRLSKVHPPDKTVLERHHAGLLPGAKIGVLGYNGAGKSTLLRIMAGVDQDFRGEAAAGARRDGRDARAGAAPRRVQGRPRQRRGGRRRDARPCWTASTSWPPTTPRRTPRRSGVSRRRSTRPTPGTSTRQLDYAMDALRLPPRRCRCLQASPAASAGAWRCAACLLRAPDLLLLDEPTNHLDAESVAWLEQHLARVHGHDRRGHPRPLLPRQRRRAGSSSSTAGAACPTRATTRAGWSRSRRAWPRKSARRRPASATIAAELEWVRTTPQGNAPREGPPRAL